MSWFILFIAGIFEVIWAILSKHSQGFTRLWPSVGTIVFNIISVALLMIAMRRLPLGTSYAVWTGIGAVGTVSYGIWRLGEPLTAPRMACIALIVAGIIGLEMLTPAQEH
ncbi:MAG TPA: multidrug efflux SMR transporter [Tepidisphaeraceae bacterium]|jgi:quaternary ammonium compound-resistance protein SugE